MTSRRSRPRRSSGSRALAVLAGVVLLRLGPALAADAAKGPGPAQSALVERRDGVEIDWAAGTVTASGGAAADLRMPSAELARPGAVRRAEVAARARLGQALSELPLGGDRHLPAVAVTRALERARTTSTEYLSNGGAVVRMTVRFVDWLEPGPTHVDAGTPLTLVVPAMRLTASPVARIGDAERALPAAVYRLGSPPGDVRAVPAKVDHAGRLVLEARHGVAEKLAAGPALIYVGKVLR